MPGGPNPFAGMQDNPFGGVLGQMFKDLEQVSKEQPTDSSQSSGAPTGMPAGMDEILKNLMGGLGEAGS